MILYLYPEEWTGLRAREIHTLSTCVALARGGTPVTLVTAGGAEALRHQLREITGQETLPGLSCVILSRSFGPIRSARIFHFHFRRWLARGPSVTLAYVIHLKAAALLMERGIPYAYEAHEIFSETPQKSANRLRDLFQLESTVLRQATWRIATSRALAEALRHTYRLPDDFILAPNAGGPPLEKNLGISTGPFLYFGSLAGWKGLEVIIAAALAAQVPLKLVGGTHAEWQRLWEKFPPHPQLLVWTPRVPLSELAETCTGARAGIIATQPETGSGRYSCPMKLFDYAQAGLPVLTTALPSLQSLDLGSWCVPVREATVKAWTEAMRQFQYRSTDADAARAWAARHTWAERAETLRKALLP